MSRTRTRRLTTPLHIEVIEELRSGDRVLLNGPIFTARDAAHRRFMEALQSGRALPFDIQGQVIYYCGPSPALPGRTIGAAGPTTSSRMDPYTPTLLSLGLKGMIGKGRRSEAVRRSMREHGAIYLGATGGAGALLSRMILSYEMVAYEDLGTEAVARLLVKDFPLFVINDIPGNDLYDIGMRRYRVDQTD